MHNGYYLLFNVTTRYRKPEQTIPIARARIPRLRAVPPLARRDLYLGSTGVVSGDARETRRHGSVTNKESGTAILDFFARPDC